MYWPSTLPAPGDSAFTWPGAVPSAGSHEGSPQTEMVSEGPDAGGSAVAGGTGLGDGLRVPWGLPV